MKHIPRQFWQKAISLFRERRLIAFAEKPSNKPVSDDKKNDIIAKVNEAMGKGKNKETGSAMKEQVLHLLQSPDSDFAVDIGHLKSDVTDTLLRLGGEDLSNEDIQHVRDGFPTTPEELATLMVEAGIITGGEALKAGSKRAQTTERSKDNTGGRGKGNPRSLREKYGKRMPEYYIPEEDAELLDEIGFAREQLSDYHTELRLIKKENKPGRKRITDIKALREKMGNPATHLMTLIREARKRGVVDTPDIARDTRGAARKSPQYEKLIQSRKNKEAQKQENLRIMKEFGQNRGAYTIQSDRNKMIDGALGSVGIDRPSRKGSKRDQSKESSNSGGDENSRYTVLPFKGKRTGRDKSSEAYNREMDKHYNKKGGREKHLKEQESIKEGYVDELFEQIENGYDDLKNHSDSEVRSLYTQVLKRLNTNIDKQGREHIYHNLARARTRLDSLRRNARMKQSNAEVTGEVLTKKFYPTNGFSGDSALRIVIPESFVSEDESRTLVIADPRRWGTGMYVGKGSEDRAVHAGIRVERRFNRDGKVSGLEVSFTKPGTFSVNGEVVQKGTDYEEEEKKNPRRNIEHQSDQDPAKSRDEDLLEDPFIADNSDLPPTPDLPNTRPIPRENPDLIPPQPTSLDTLVKELKSNPGEKETILPRITALRNEKLSTEKTVYIVRSTKPPVLEKGISEVKNGKKIVKGMEGESWSEKFDLERMYLVKEIEEGEGTTWDIDSFLKKPDAVQFQRRKHNYIENQLQKLPQSLSKHSYRELFETHSDLRDDVKQSPNIGDCYLIAGLKSLQLSDHGEVIIRSSMFIDAKGNYHVKIPMGMNSDGEDYIIKPKDLNSSTSLYRNLLSGDTGWKVLEVAFAMKRAKNKNRPMRNTEDQVDLGLLDSGNSSAALRQLVHGVTDSSVSDKFNMVNYFRNYSNGKDIATATSRIDTSKTDAQKYTVDGVSFFMNHAYSIVDVNKEKQTVKIVNPHDTRKVLEISFKTFCSAFYQITAVQVDQRDIASL